jgi:hypothetical protein
MIDSEVAFVSICFVLFVSTLLIAFSFMIFGLVRVLSQMNQKSLDLSMVKIKRQLLKPVKSFMMNSLISIKRIQMNGENSL